MKPNNFQLVFFAKDCLLTGQEQACSRITPLFVIVRRHAKNGPIHRKMVVDCPLEITSTVKLEHNCTIFFCSLDVRNIVQGGDPLYAGFFSTQGSGGYT